MQQQAADAFRRRDLVTGAFVRLDVGVMEKGLAFFDADKRIADIRFAGADRFDLAAL